MSVSRKFPGAPHALSRHRRLFKTQLCRRFNDVEDASLTLTNKHSAPTSAAALALNEQRCCYDVRGCFETCWARQSVHLQKPCLLGAKGVYPNCDAVQHSELLPMLQCRKAHQSVHCCTKRKRAGCLITVAKYTACRRQRQWPLSQG
jgi:hypothetical protein